MSVDILGTSWTNAEAWFSIALRPRKPEGSLGRTAQDGQLDSHTAPELWKFEKNGKIWGNGKIWEKWDKLFKALKVWKVSGVCDSLWILWSSECEGKTISLSVKNCISQEWTVKNVFESCCAKSQRMHFLSVLFERVRWPLATVRVAPLYRMCGRVAYLCAAFPHHIASIMPGFVKKFVKWFVKSLWILKGFFCTNPVKCTFNILLHRFKTSP